MLNIPLEIYIEILAFITSVICWPKLKSTSLRWFPLFLLFISCVEFTAWYIRKRLHLPNAWIFNVSIVFEYGFYFYLFYKYLTNRIYKKLILISLLLLVGTSIYINLVEDFAEFHSQPLLIGNFSIVILCCLYFFQIIQSEDYINLVREPLFWISSGLFLFNLGELLCSSLSILYDVKNQLIAGELIKKINNNLILLLYPSYIFGFIFMNNHKK